MRHYLIIPQSCGASYFNFDTKNNQTYLPPVSSDSVQFKDRELKCLYKFNLLLVIYPFLIMGWGLGEGQNKSPGGQSIPYIIGSPSDLPMAETEMVAEHHSQKWLV